MIIYFFKLLPILISIYIFSLGKSTKLLSTPIEEVYYSTHCISIQYSYSTKIHFLTLDLNSSFTWLYGLQSTEDILNQRTNYIINKNIELKFKSYILHGQEVNRSIHFINNLDYLITFRFYEIDSHISGLQGVLGLNYQFEDYTHSIIHQIKQLGYVDHLSFSLIQDQQYKQLFIGGIHINFTEGRTHSSCDVLPGYTNWNCLLSRITIQNSTLELSYHVNSPFI